MPAPTKTPTKTPLVNPDANPGPDEHYQPERLCPDQRQRGTWKAKPQE